MTPTLTLYKLDSELTELLDYRQERIEDAQSPASAEELEACDIAIRQYMEALPAKVDRVAAVLRYFDEQVDWADREIRRLKARKSAIEENAERLKDCVSAVLEKQPANGKSRKLVGQHSTLMLKGNGGVAPVVISQPELVPSDYCVYRLELDYPIMNAIMLAVEDAWEDSRVSKLEERITRVPSNTLIREALIQPCAACDGTEPQRCCNGVDCACMGKPIEPDCESCGGTGRASVPGAHLGDRGVHVEVR